MIKEITTNQYFLLALTFGIYQGAKMLQRKTGSILLNPILIAIGLIILLLEAMDIPYETYYESGKMIDFWLKPAVVALGVPLYLQLSQIKKQFIPILASQMMGCIVGIVSVVITAQIRHNTYRNGSYTVSRRYSFVDSGYSRNYGIDRWSSWFQDDVGRSYQ